jgi:uncharacterized protein (DUF1501 family)
MTPFTRREILKVLAAAGVYGGVMPLGGLNNLVFASEPSSRSILVIVHLRGGCDGLNFVSPASDPDFISARASELRVSDEGKDSGYPLEHAPAKDIDFRLHTAAGGIAELYKHGDIAFIHACGLTDATRSHFVATDMIERGVGSTATLSATESGWLTRSIEAQHRVSSNGLQAISISGAVTGDLQGLEGAIAIPDINYGLPMVGGAGVATALWNMYSNDKGPIGEAGRLALQLPSMVDQKIRRDADGHVIPYQPENGVNYNMAGGFANALKSAARLIKMDVGLQAITLDYGNWDTHEYQQGRFKNLVEPFSNGLTAFWNDLPTYHDRMVVVALTEFGRRLRSNKSGGTDHGRGSLMFVLGGNVRGGRFYGKWPGLSSAQLEEGVDLAVTTDYRRVLTEVLDHVNGSKSSHIFPNYLHQESLGIF